MRLARGRGEAGSELAGALSDLGSIYQDSDGLADAARCYSEAIAPLKGGGESSSRLLVARRNLPRLRLTQTRYSEAEKLYRGALELAVSDFGNDSSEIA